MILRWVRRICVKKVYYLAVLEGRQLHYFHRDHSLQDHRPVLQKRSHQYQRHRLSIPVRLQTRDSIFSFQSIGSIGSIDPCNSFSSWITGITIRTSISLWSRKTSRSDGTFWALLSFGTLISVASRGTGCSWRSWSSQIYVETVKIDLLFQSVLETVPGTPLAPLVPLDPFLPSAPFSPSLPGVPSVPGSPLSPTKRTFYWSSRQMRYIWCTRWKRKENKPGSPGWPMYTARALGDNKLMYCDGAWPDRARGRSSENTEPTNPIHSDYEPTYAATVEPNSHPRRWPFPSRPSRILRGSSWTWSATVRRWHQRLLDRCTLRSARDHQRPRRGMVGDSIWKESSVDAAVLVGIREPRTTRPY